MSRRRWLLGMGAALGSCWGSPREVFAQPRNSHPKAPVLTLCSGQRVAQARAFQLLSNQKAQVHTPQGHRQFDWAEVLEWGEPLDPQPPLRFKPSESAYVLLARRGLLVADLIQGTPESLVVESLELGRLELPWSLVQGVLVAPPQNPLVAQAWELDARSHQGPQDLCFLRNGDQVQGTLVRLDSQRVQMRLTSGTIRIELSQVKALALNPKLLQLPERLAVPHAWLALADGSLFVADRMKFQEAQVQARMLGALPLQFPAKRVVWVQPQHTHVVHLSDLPVAQFRHIPLLRWKWPLGRDRNTGGGYLRTAGRKYLKGLGMHALAQATFLLRKPYLRFLSLVGVDDQAGEGGEVVFRVLTHHRHQGKVRTRLRFTSEPQRFGQPPQWVHVELEDAVGLTLVVQYAGGGDLHDWANWLQPVLIAPKEQTSH